MAKKTYSESDIKVLKGLDPVRERPGMFTRTDNPTHICQEVIDNAADEALGGHADRIDVVWHDDGSVSVSDNGRGIPTGIHPEEGVSVAELVFTRLHAGGKFDKKGGAYGFSGGLHGVGVSVSNALSTRLEVQIRRDGNVYEMAFAGGEVNQTLHKTGKSRETGTTVRLWPDGKYFDSPNIHAAELERLLRAKAVLLPGLTVTLTRKQQTRTWHYPAGLSGYLGEMADLSGVSVFAVSKYMKEHDVFHNGEGVDVALAWPHEGGGRESYVNLIPTPAGGTHDSGLKQAVFQAVGEFAGLHALLPRGIKLQSEDVCGGMSYVLSAKILDPQFQGQTKDRLSNRDAVKLVPACLKDPFLLWLNANLDEGKRIVEMAVRQAQSRIKSGKKVEKRKGSGVAVLPGKLTDCESSDIRENELFLVEGDSAGGSAKLARDKATQAVLPLRGKVLNSWETDADRLFANEEIHNIAVAVGVDPHEAGKGDLSGLRYGKIAVLSDADVDGLHIQVLLLTLFYRHFPDLIGKGHVYVAQPPLFRVDMPKSGRKPLRKLYAADQAELDALLKKLAKEGVKNHTVSRFKGLGEMNPDQLKDTTLNPDTRRLLQVAPADTDTEAAFSLMMAKGEAAGRRKWMEDEGDKAAADA